MSRSSNAPTSAGEVFGLIRDGTATTRAEVGRRTGLSRTAVAARVSALEARGLVLERAETLSTGGRPPARLELNADAGVVLSAAIGRSRTQLGVCNLAGEVLTMADVDQEIGIGPYELMPDIAKRLEALLGDTGRRVDEVLGVGLSIPGTADTARGCSLDSPTMSGWDGIALAPYLRDLTAAPILLDNDANVIVLSERRGQRDRFDDMLLIKASTGLGAGIVAGGVLQRGAVGAAGEFGHTKIAGRRRHRLPLRRHRLPGGDRRWLGAGPHHAPAGPQRGTRPRPRRPRHRRRPRSAPADQGSGRHIGEVLAGAVNLLNPEALVIAGDMSKAYDILVAGLRETVYGNATALATRELQILPSTHGDQSGVIGSAAMILDHVLSAQAVDAALSTLA